MSKTITNLLTGVDPQNRPIIVQTVQFVVFGDI